MLLEASVTLIWIIAIVKHDDDHRMRYSASGISLHRVVIKSPVCRRCRLHLPAEMKY